MQSKAFFSLWQRVPSEIIHRKWHTQAPRSSFKRWWELYQLVVVYKPDIIVPLPEPAYTTLTTRKNASLIPEAYEGNSQWLACQLAWSSSGQEWFEDQALHPHQLCGWSGLNPHRPPASHAKSQTAHSCEPDHMSKTIQLQWQKVSTLKWQNIKWLSMQRTHAAHVCIIHLFLMI